MIELVERIDHTVLAWLDSRASTPWLDRRALEATALGDGFTVTALVVIAGAILWSTGARIYAACLAGSAAGAALLTPLLKNTFDRPRPAIVDARTYVIETSYAYPSGHALLATATLCATAYIIHRLAMRRAVTAAATLLAALAIVLVGWSRLHLGVHYPSDVIAGHTLGLCWALLCIHLAEAARRRSRATTISDLKPIEER